MITINYTHEIKDIENISNENVDIPATLAMIKRSYVRYIDNQIKKEDINAGEFPFLLVLNEKDEITQKELADSLKTSEGLVTRVSKRLEKNGYITREVDSKNKRRNLIRITSKGKDIAQKVITSQELWETHTFSFLSDEELNQFKLALKLALINSIEVEDGIQ